MVVNKCLSVFIRLVMRFKYAYKLHCQVLLILLIVFSYRVSLFLLSVTCASLIWKIQEKVFRTGYNVDAIKSILMPIASSLLQQKIAYPLTIIYNSLHLCGFAYKLFEHVLGIDQYFPPWCNFNSSKQAICTVPFPANKTNEGRNPEAALFWKK